ncbi:galactose oxidase [Mucilaginibacter sp. L196]|uniref:galactose oxidase n=1 Tax=Mucilaginibacter sp. L196 TaxID=1641870 RepID=UPI00131CBA6B|nr:galactose oxidase [Mucilaginibacter sp. L196]
MRLGSRIFKIVFCFLFIFIILTANSYGQSYGLAFSSHEVFQDKRTSLDLSPDKTLCFNDNFDISFDLSFIPNHEVYFGYIIRIIEDDNRNIDLVYNAEANKKHFNIIVGDRLSNIAFDIDHDKLFNQWNHVRIKFDTEHDKIILYNGKATYTETGLHLKKNSCYKILFGVNNYKQFQTTDIPPMKIRDIKITENNQLKYNWPLNEISGQVAHEIVAQNDAATINPVWVTAMHRDWQPVQNISVKGIASIAFDAQKEEVYVIASDSLYSYSVGTAKWNDKAYAKDKLELNKGNQSIYNPFDNSLYNFFPDQQFVSKYSFQNNEWNKKFLAWPVTDYWQLNKFFSKTDTSLYFLGGYGHLVYKNIVQQYHLKTGAWNNEVKTKGDFFTPRYLAGLGSTADGDTVYVLGGYGNTSGQQILDPRNIYSMMRFTVKDKTFKKLFELKVNGEDFAFANSLVIDDRAQTYYGLIFPQHKYNSTLQLIKGSLTNPTYTLMGNAIPYSFHDTHSFADLYYCPLSKRFIAVTLLRTENNNETKVQIYTLLSPPYGTSTLPVIAKSTTKWYVIGMLILAAFIMLWVYLKNRKGVPIDIVHQPEPVVILNNTINAGATNMPVSDARVFNQNADFKNAILLFGDLQIFDAEGVDITKYFTPLIKELFLVILLYSIRWGRGLSSEKLNEILWHDKSAKSARNNRSVNIGKLKTLLDKMGYCYLSKDTGYWKIDIDYNHIYIDYHNYLNIVKDKKDLDIERIKCLSAITKRGNFLSNIEYEWLDTFKSEISNEVIDTYIHFAHSGHTNDSEFMVELANFIFYFDPVNEEAMVIKCKALSSLGKHSLAKNTFENFIKEYKVIYGEEFKKDFHSVLE